MKQTDGFFLIHNYNTVPLDLLDYCGKEHYEIMDCSDDGETPAKLRALGLKVTSIPNTGHNITSYFSWFADHYEALPEVIFLLKGNILHRHCSREYFERVLQNTWFTFLYEEKQLRERYSKPSAAVLAANHGKDPNQDSIASLVTESEFLEQNNDWYMQTGTHPCRYFTSYDALLRFVYRDPVLPRQILFAPGGCYIVRREQIQLHGKNFYRNLNKLMNYTMDPAFPAEAYLVERMLPTILEARYEVNPWMEDPKAFDQKIEAQKESLEQQRARERAEGRSVVHRLGRRLRRFADRE